MEKIWWLFAQLYDTKTSTDCLVLEAYRGRFQNRICILLLLSHQQARKVNEFLYIAIKEWEQLQLTHNSKFVEGQGNYYDKTQKVFKITRVQVIKYEFL